MRAAASSSSAASISRPAARGGARFSCARAKRKRKGPAFAGPSYAYAYATLLLYKRLRPASPEDRGAGVAVRRLDGGGMGRELRRDTLGRCLADGVVDVGTAQAEVGQFAVAHAEQLGLGGAQLEVGLQCSGAALKLAGHPHDGIGQEMRDHLRTRVPRVQLQTGAVLVAKTGLGNVSPRRRSFAGQILKDHYRLGHHGKLR